MASTDPATLAARAYAEGERLWQQGQPEAALAHLLRAVAVNPAHPNAKNFAGWLLTTRHRGEPEALAHGITLLAEAHALAPAEDRPLYNLVEALVAAGQRSRALAVADAAVAARPHAPQPWNLRGWLRGLADGADDPQGALADLEQATKNQPWYGEAHFNRARLALQTGDERLAYLAFQAAVLAGNCSRKVEAHLRLGELAARRGHLRRALGHLRRGAELDLAGTCTQLLHTGVQNCGAYLQQGERYFLHAIDEARRAAWIESRALAPAPPPLRSLAKHASALVPALRELKLYAALDAIEQIVACAEAGELLAKFSDRSPTMTLELAAGGAATPEDLRARLAKLAAQWSAAQHDLYEELLAREESDPDDPGSARARVAEHAKARRWHDALAELAALDTGDDHDLQWRGARAEQLAGRARRDGDEAAAQALYELALHDARVYASGASAGAEGMARMVDVDRLTRLLAGEDA